MPYIKPEKRKRLDDALQVFEGQIDSEGELNYVITKIVLIWTGEKSKILKKFSYEIGNSAMGVLDSAKHEFYRRMMVPYEDKKIQENGDVYPEE